MCVICQPWLLKAGPCDVGYLKCNNSLHTQLTATCTVGSMTAVVATHVHVLLWFWIGKVGTKNVRTRRSMVGCSAPRCEIKLYVKVGRGAQRRKLSFFAKFGLNSMAHYGVLHQCRWVIDTDNNSICNTVLAVLLGVPVPEWTNLQIDHG